MEIHRVSVLLGLGDGNIEQSFQVRVNCKLSYVPHSVHSSTVLSRFTRILVSVVIRYLTFITAVVRCVHLAAFAIWSTVATDAGLLAVFSAGDAGFDLLVCRFFICSGSHLEVVDWMIGKESLDIRK